MPVSHYTINEDKQFSLCIHWLGLEVCTQNWLTCHLVFLIIFKVSLHQFYSVLNNLHTYCNKKNFPFSNSLTRIYLFVFCLFLFLFIVFYYFRLSGLDEMKSVSFYPLFLTEWIILNTNCLLNFTFWQSSYFINQFIYCIVWKFQILPVLGSIISDIMWFSMSVPHIYQHNTVF